MGKIGLHWQIIIGIFSGIILGVSLIQFNWGNQFIIDWIKPFGTIFINLLKLIAIPLIVVSLIKGVTDLKDITQLSSMGLKTFAIYLVTTVFSISIGLMIVNAIKPGSFISESTRTEMIASFGGEVGEKVATASLAKDRGPLQALIDIVPENLVFSASNNGNMLQIIFFALLFGISMLMLPNSKTEVLKKVFEAGNDVVLKIVDIIMLFAPFGVFALMATLVAESPSVDIFKALAAYSLTVFLGLLLLVYGFYALMLKFFGGINPITFYKNLAPAQLVAFSTSSSAATLPVTMECVEERIGVHKEVSSFVLPIGATVNMDGTSLYQGVAAVFIAQVLGYDLSLGEQLSILLTATLASLGSAAVPGAGILMLVIVLESIGINSAGIALIFAVDRPLDMLRTATNVTGDAMVAVIVNKISGKSLTPVIPEQEN